MVPEVAIIFAPYSKIEAKNGPSSLLRFLERQVPICPWHEGEIAQLQTVQDLRICDIQFPIAEVGHFCTVLKEADPVIADLQFQFVSDFAQQDLAIHKTDIFFDFLKFSIGTCGHTFKISAELRELNFNAVLVCSISVLTEEIKASVSSFR